VPISNSQHFTFVLVLPNEALTNLAVKRFILDQWRWNMSCSTGSPDCWTISEWWWPLESNIHPAKVKVLVWDKFDL